jgi:signal transduction histidine kinase
LTRWWRDARKHGPSVSPRVLDVVLIMAALLIGALVVVDLMTLEEPLWYVTDRTTASLLLVAGALGSAPALWWRRQHPVAVTLVGILATVLGQSAALWFALGTLAARRRDRVLGALIILGGVALFVKAPPDDSNPWPDLLGAMVGAGTCAVWGAYVGTRHDLVTSLRGQLDRAAAEREMRIEQARMAERARIAREMHDVLAHKMSLITLHAGGLWMNPADGPAQVARTAELIQGMSREAIDDLREVLGVLRNGSADTDLGPAPGIDDLDALITSSRQAGLPVDVVTDVTGDPSEALGRTVFRVVQEALTNVHKHTGDAATTVLLRGAPGRGLDIEVVNQAPRPGRRLAGSGLGLVGLAERVRLVGGDLSYGARPDGGWHLHARLPFPAPRHRPPRHSNRTTGDPDLRDVNPGDHVRGSAVVADPRAAS